MHPHITTFLLILTTSSSARYLDHHVTNQWSTKDMQQVHDCLDASTGNWYWSGGQFHIVFDDPNDLDFTYGITTGWDVYYPNTLYQLLQAHGFSVQSKSGITQSGRCGWWNAGTVRADHHDRGAIYWKYSDLRRRPDVPDFGNASSWEADSIDHIPPHISTVPSAATLNWIRDMLVANAPTADILYIYVLVLSIATVLMSMLSVQVVTWYYYRSTKTKEDEDTSDIELDEIRVHNLSGASMQRMADDARVETPDMSGNTTKADAGSPLSMSSSGSIADPPPIYTLDGARR